jgi:hypothetical protein
MKRFVFVFLLFLAPAFAWAATVTIPNGSIAIVYVNSSGSVIYQPFASVSDSVAAQFVTWCEAHYSSSSVAATASGCFNTWADDWLNQTVRAIQVFQTPAPVAPALIFTPAQ